jgi:P pilus assembly chaperone PapD
MKHWLRKNRSLFSLLAALLLVYLTASACASSLKLSPTQPIYPYRGLNENTILGPW